MSDAAAETFDELAGAFSPGGSWNSRTLPMTTLGRLGGREVFASDYVLHSRIGGTVVGVDAYIERIAGSGYPATTSRWTT